MDEMLLLGDFNMSNLQWTYDVDIPININRYETRFLNGCHENCLHQINQYPNNENKFLDLFLYRDIFKLKGAAKIEYDIITIL